MKHFLLLTLPYAEKISRSASLVTFWESRATYTLYLAIIGECGGGVRDRRFIGDLDGFRDERELELLEELLLLRRLLRELRVPELEEEELDESVLDDEDDDDRERLPLLFTLLLDFRFGDGDGL